MNSTAPSGLRDPGRLAMLERLSLLDASADEAFDRLARLTSQLLNAPVALVSLVGEDRQRFRGCVGLPEPWASWRETPLSHSFCQHTVTTGEPLVIEDARTHPIVQDNLAIRDLGVVAYAGIPLMTGEGHVLGSFCAIDHQPRQWTAEQLDWLRSLAASAMTEIELRARIVEQERTEAALRRSEQQYRQLFQSSPLPMWIYDPETLEILEVNERAVVHYGYSREEFLVTTLLDLRLQEDVPALEEDRRAPPSPEGITLRGRFRHRKKDETLIDAEVSTQEILFRGRPARLALVDDVTERRRAEEMQAILADAGAALNQSLDYRATLKRVADLVVPVLADHCAIDIVEPDRTIHRIEVALADSAPADLAQCLRDRYAPTWDSAQPAAEVLRTGQTVYAREVGDRSLAKHARDEEHLSILRTLGVRSVLAVPLVARGRTLGALTFTTGSSGRYFEDHHVALVEEIGRRAAIALDNARLHSKAREATRSREAVLSIVAHEMKQPLNAVVVASEVLSLQLSGMEREQKQIKTIQRSSGQMLRLVQDLADITRIEAGHFRVRKVPTGVTALLQEAVEELAPTTDTRILLETSFGTGVPVVLADEQRMLQAISNLVVNALRFSPPGQPVRLTAATERDSVRISITDSGPGIPEQQLPHLFERFWQGESSTGSGLGLAIVKGIVEAHAGTISLESEVGRGSTFSISLPIYHGSTDGESNLGRAEALTSFASLPEMESESELERSAPQDVGTQKDRTAEWRARLLAATTGTVGSAGAEADLASRIRDSLLHAVHTGHLRPGDQLPSIREMSRAFGVGYYQVLKAVDVLDREGFVEKRNRSGTYLAPQSASQGEPLSETPAWIAGILLEAFQHQIRVPLLSRLLDQWATGASLRCACIESTTDHLVSLCTETGAQFGLESFPVNAAGIPAAENLTRKLAEELFPQLCGADLFCTTMFHAATARNLAKLFDKPLVVATLAPSVAAVLEHRLQEGRLIAVCADPQMGERLKGFKHGMYRDRIQVVLAEDPQAVAELDPAEPVLFTRAAQQVLGSVNLRLLIPLSPSYSTEFAREMAELIVRLNIQSSRVEWTREH